MKNWRFQFLKFLPHKKANRASYLLRPQIKPLKQLVGELTKTVECWLRTWLLNHQTNHKLQTHRKIFIDIAWSKASQSQNFYDHWLHTEKPRFLFFVWQVTVFSLASILTPWTLRFQVVIGYLGGVINLILFLVSGIS